MVDHIFFPDSASWETANGSISFPAEVHGRRIKCVLPADTLKMIAEASAIPHDPIGLFRATQTTARAVARALLLKGRGMATGKLIIKPEDWSDGPN